VKSPQDLFAGALGGIATKTIGLFTNPETASKIGGMPVRPPIMPPIALPVPFVLMPIMFAIDDAACPSNDRRHDRRPDRHSRRGGRAGPDRRAGRQPVHPAEVGTDRAARAVRLDADHVRDRRRGLPLERARQSLACIFAWA
jgi:hypothetical protein